MLFKEIVTSLVGNFGRPKINKRLHPNTRMNEELNKTAKRPISSMGIIRTSESPPRRSGD